MKKIKLFITFIMMLTLSNKLVLANTNNIIDFSKTGTVEINLKENKNNTPITDAEITLYQIANATLENDNLVFIYHENITNCELDLSNLQNENLPKEIDKCIKNMELPSQTKLTNQEGIVNFDELRLGLYLVKQTNKVEGYSNIEPFLISIPQIEDNKWIYDIKAIPKTDIIKIINLTVKKVWNDSTNKQSHPKSVTVELYKETQLIDTVTLNEENNWTYTWLEIEKSDEYSVIEKNIPVGYTVNYRQEGNNFIVTNTKTLVQTGNNILAIELLAILGVIFIITGLIYKKRNKL